MHRLGRPQREGETNKVLKLTDPTIFDCMCGWEPSLPARSSFRFKVVQAMDGGGQQELPK